jgi:RND family efflux transporter MFP subunit
MIQSSRFAAKTLWLVAAAILVGCGGEETAPPSVIRPVRYQQVFATGGSRVRTFSGAARAGVESRLSFRVAGKVQRLAVKVGDRVRSGQLIAQLDPKDYELQVQEAEAALEQAQAQARNAAASYDRVRALYENRNASRNDLDAARASDESAKAAVESAAKRHELAQSRLSYTKLTAPIDGAIAAVDCEINENVKAGDEIALLTSGSRMEVDIGVPEILISQVREGEPVEVTFDALPGRTFAARVSEVGVASTELVTTFPVTVILDRETPDIRPGMAAQVALQFGTGDIRERFIVPAVAVGEDRQGRCVYTVEPTESGLGVTHRKAVTVGELTADGLEVLDGLTDGELLVTAGVNRIEDGQTVRLLPEHEDRR